MNRNLPTVPGHAIFGSLFEFRSDRVGFLTRIAAEYGDIAKVKIGLFFRAVVVSAPDLARETLIERNDAFVKGFGLSIFGKPLLGNGLVTSEGDVHKRQRRMIAPAFMHKRIAEYANTISRYAERSVEHLRALDTVDLSHEMMELTFEIVGKTLFNADVSGDAKDVGDALTQAMENMIGQINSVIPLPPSIPSPANLRGRKIIARLDDVVYRLIRERRASGKDEGDFLSMLLLAQDEDDGGVMTDKQVRDEAMTIMLAGHETTANALAWTFYLLAKHPDVRARLEGEVDRVLGGRAPVLADLASLPYTLQVLKESMRIYPPVYMVVRRATRDVSIGAYDVRKNDAVVIDIIGMHRRAELFPDPMRFDPDRFSVENEKAMPKHAYIPFSVGPRVCIGNHFAMMEGQIILAHLAQHLRFDLVDASTPVIPEPLVTLRPKGGIQVRVRRRAVRDVTESDGSVTATV